MDDKIITQKEYMKYNRQIGYSLYGYWKKLLECIRKSELTCLSFSYTNGSQLESFLSHIGAKHINIENFENMESEITSSIRDSTIDDIMCGKNCSQIYTINLNNRYTDFNIITIIRKLPYNIIILLHNNDHFGGFSSGSHRLIIQCDFVFSVGMDEISIIKNRHDKLFKIKHTDYLNKIN